MSNETDSDPTNCDIDGHNSSPPRNERQEYFIALEKWLTEAYAWESFSSSISQMIMSNEYDPCNLSRLAYPLDFADELDDLAPDEPMPDPPEPPPIGRFDAGIFRRANQPTRVRPMEALLCKIPPLWKRVMAEFLDFLILFFVKLAITFLAIDLFDAIDLDGYGSKVVDQYGQINYTMVWAATSQVLILEFIHRVVVCMFEAYWLRGGRNGDVGGSTPGKALMGLRVVSCIRAETINNQAGNMVLVFPGTDLGLAGSISRAVLKNLILAILFPLCFALFFFKHQRTGYDVVCRSIVVEKPRRHML